MDNVKLTNQCFRCAGGRGAFSNLEMTEMIFISERGEYNKGKRDAFLKANSMMSERANELGCSHVFEMQYTFIVDGLPTGNTYSCEVIGTGYGSRSNKKP
ncbi:MAG: hypothetical protein KAI03_05720 [Candidatus Aureabacteria bacterium]|nr:hypothetical protein [Candidatus Auribacterota bacterium]